jgi:hypothetical protein
MKARPVAVRVFAAPDAACSQGATWSSATALVADRLRRLFGDAVAVEHLEIFSPRSFEFPEVMAAIEAGGALPIVTVADRIVSQGGKLSAPVIRRAVEALLASDQTT